jgi:hypothetical protein
MPKTTRRVVNDIVEMCSLVAGVIDARRQAGDGMIEKSTKRKGRDAMQVESRAQPPQNDNGRIRDCYYSIHGQKSTPLTDGESTKVKVAVVADVHNVFDGFGGR